MIYQGNHFTTSCKNLENCEETEVMRREVEKRRGLAARPVAALWVVGGGGESWRAAGLRDGSLERPGGAAKRQAGRIASTS